ncbi:MAG TPA: Rieske 2Fe-2S domain-containing protein [Acidimicrobiia bacterium]|nr:Rieske 2Fe-2S domain-containing protein [Acidimicrobiia bacterium]
MAVIIVGVLVLIGLAGLFVVGTARRRATGRLSRETRRADASEPPPEAAPSAPEGAEPVAGEDPRQRADESRRAIESGGGLPVPAGERGVTRYEPVDDEELGITRRQFFNRGILTGMLLAVSGFGAAALGFLWPGASSAGGFGSKINIGNKSDIDAAIAKKTPYYNATAKVYINPYPKDALPKAKKIYAPIILSGLQLGYVALYQRCVHLGCRVPWCLTSQWFECPCHGSKYNRVGEKRGGPAPRGLDRFPFSLSGGSMVVDTGTIIQGPPIGTDTTGQAAEGAPCV